MRPGPPTVIECPSCQALQEYGTFSSGNTFGGRSWTDGYGHYPFMPSPAHVARCPVCKKPYWLLEAREIGSRRSDSEIAPAPNVEWLSEQDLLEAVSQGLARNREEELLLRKRAWHCANHDFRDFSFRLRGSGKESPARDAVDPSQPQSSASFSPAARENLESLFMLLDVSEPNERMLKAEIARELGNFSEAKQILDSPIPMACRQAAPVSPDQLVLFAIPDAKEERAVDLEETESVIHSLQMRFGLIRKLVQQGNRVVAEIKQPQKSIF